MHSLLTHPADQILQMMERIYHYGMTTTSGGNVSLLDENGDIWITPAGVDKGSLRRQDIVCVKRSGEVLGLHRPSSEFPFHQQIYRQRPDLKAVVHAHPPALVAFSMVRRLPNLYLLPNDYQICGDIGMAEYALPGSEELGQNIASVFSEGVNAVMLENHGVVIGSNTLYEAFNIFETLDYCARLEIKANRLGIPLPQGKESIGKKMHANLDEFSPVTFSAKEKELRRDMCELIHRAYDQKLFTSTQGTFSQRLEDGSFIITPYAVDRKYLEPEDLVRIEHGKKEAGKMPSRSVLLHQQIYETQPHVGSIIIAHPPNIMAFAVTDSDFDSRTIPESYILLRTIPKLPYGMTFHSPLESAKVFREDTPLALVANDCVIVTGQNLLNAFDRLEVAEYSAKALISTRCLGEIVPIDEKKIKEIDIAFKLS
ncbi:class II aldolase/adducin family protein [Paenibacillus sp. GD4]|uniref:class II aldolase/adducin family protein n=1 Tax=Paenibacillus sp. GD4 TaxID=3068890 RepID=UPI0027969D45|nr:class II aldolase/adducin family protein [Paenibacillus sp. GD4]MDQ1912503.1 class II aldolase/adducin family protein [Paenibacillus sp. GD4]